MECVGTRGVKVRARAFAVGFLLNGVFLFRG